MLQEIYNNIIIPWLILGFITFLILLKVSAPYGKFSNKNWGPQISFEFGWFCSLKNTNGMNANILISPMIA